MWLRAAVQLPSCERKVPPLDYSITDNIPVDNIAAAAAVLPQTTLPPSPKQCGNTYLEMPVIVHEFVHHAVSEEEVCAGPQPYNSRAKLWRVLLPPDQLNPQGYIDAALDNFSPMEVCVVQHQALSQTICVCCGWVLNTRIVWTCVLVRKCWWFGVAVVRSV